MAAGWLYDGETALRRSVEVSARPPGLSIVTDSGEQSQVDSVALHHVESRADAEVYGRQEQPGWRLGILKPVPPEIAELLPARRVYGRWIDRIGLVPALAIGLVISASVIVIGQFFPAWVAPMVPRSWERSFGDALVGDFGGKFCAASGGQQALDRLTAKLSPHPERLRVRVVNMPVVNAAALPGGNIMIFRELIEKAEGPDEVAGVLAHEIAHVEERHVTQMMIRQFGLSLLLASVGGSTGANVETLMSARYSRGSEAEADERAIEALRRANISPLPTAGFFARLADIEGQLGAVADSLSYLSSHPLSRSRREKFERAADKRRAYTPSLTADEWKALSDICAGKKPLGDGSLFGS